MSLIHVGQMVLKLRAVMRINPSSEICAISFVYAMLQNVKSGGLFSQFLISVTKDCV